MEVRTHEGSYPIVAAMQGGGWTPPTKMLAGDFLEQWLRDYAAGAVSVKSQRNYSDIIHKHLIPAPGHVPLTLVSAQTVQGFCSRKLQEGLSPTSVHSHYRVLHEALGHAVRWGLLARNPASMADPPHPCRYQPRVWDEEQVRMFLAEARRSGGLLSRVVGHHLHAQGVILQAQAEGARSADQGRSALKADLFGRPHPVVQRLNVRLVHGGGDLQVFAKTPPGQTTRRRKPLSRLERETGIEPATFSLARRRSTPELLPLVRNVSRL